MPAGEWPRVGPVRRFVVFVLGIAIVVDALTGSHANLIAELVVGAALLGVVPVDELLAAMAADWRLRGRERRHHRDV